MPLLERSDQKLGADLALPDNAIRKGEDQTTSEQQTDNRTTGSGEETEIGTNIR